MRTLALLVLICLLPGCAAGAKDQLVPLDQVPPTMMETAKSKLPNVVFEQALKRSDGSWEIRGRDPKGKTRDVELSATGEFLEIE